MLTREELENHQCKPGESRESYDGRGIYICRVCDLCEDAKMRGYRPDILKPYTQADVDEPIEPDDGAGW